MLYKQYSIVDAKTKEVIEEFNTLESAEKFLIFMKTKGEDVIMTSNPEDMVEDNKTFEIEGLEIEEQEDSYFGSDLDEFNEGDRPGMLDLPEVDNDDL